MRRVRLRSIHRRGQWLKTEGEACWDMKFADINSELLEPSPNAKIAWRSNLTIAFFSLHSMLASCFRSLSVAGVVCSLLASDSTSSSLPSFRCRCHALPAVCPAMKQWDRQKESMSQSVIWHITTNRRARGAVWTLGHQFIADRTPLLKAACSCKHEVVRRRSTFRVSAAKLQNAVSDGCFNLLRPRTRHDIGINLRARHLHVKIDTCTSRIICNVRSLCVLSDTI